MRANYTSKASAAIEALAANVTDEMVAAFARDARFRLIGGVETDMDHLRRSIAAAISVVIEPAK